MVKINLVKMQCKNTRKMNLLELNRKLRTFFWSRIVKSIRHKKYYYTIYKSWWHLILYKKEKASIKPNFFTSIPNRGAGIGHQLANWISGYWFAKQFGLNFAHIPFSTLKWENFLGFGENEISAKELITNHAYKKVKLPPFNEKNTYEISLIKRIIDSYKNQKVVFITEQDQRYQDQLGVMENIRYKFHHAKARREDRIIYTKNTFNIAIHVRRGDIEIGQKNKNPNLIMRWQNNSYFQKVLTTVIQNLKTEKPIAIYLFSQGKRNEFREFEKFDNMHFCLDMNAQDSFLHMVFSDLLITSKSSFSYKPALLSDGIKICPKDFWHGYPSNSQWILVEKDGSINKTEFAKLKKKDF